MDTSGPYATEAVLPRFAADHVRRVLGVSPVVVVMGARQTGKSTLVQTLPVLQGIPYLTLDDLDVWDQAHMRAFREEYGDRVRGGLLLHTGTETFWITEKVLATPWWRVL